MRTLNRPMFRYGGPIKEGVMNGIREPKKDGGSMTQRVQPSNDGSRPGYAGPLLALPALGAAAMTAARAGARYIPKGINYLKNLARTKTGTKTAGTVRIPGAPGTPGRFTNQGSTVVNKAGPGQNIYEPNFLGRDPTVRLIGGIYRGVTSPTSKGALQSTARFVISPTGLATGVIYANGKFFNKKGEEVEKPEGDIKIGGTADIKGGGADSEPKVLSEAEREAATIAARKKQMDMYREIMDIKGMKKDATYKALIDASQLITAEGDFKGSIKDGSLISKLIGATSKRFDKVSDTETALRSLVAKGEITKDMNKEDKALTNELTRKKIEVADKQLSGDTFLEKVEKFTLSTKGTPPSGAALANLMRTSEIPVSEVADTTEVLNWLGKNKGKDEIDYIVNQVKVGITNGNPLDPGVYVVRDRIVIIDENGNVKPGPI